MAKVYATPGVYIEEKSAFPNSAVPVATAVPAFIGYTEWAVRNKKDLTNKPTRISSFGEFLLYFGGPPKTVYELKKSTDPNEIYTLDPKSGRYLLFYSMKLFFANGGSDCYIVSVGKYGATPARKDFNDETVDATTKEVVLKGIKTLTKEPEPTMVVIPEAVLLGQDECGMLQQEMLSHCKEMGSRVAILDVFMDENSKILPNTREIAANFRLKVGNNHLQWGAAYYPWLNTAITSADAVDFTNLDAATLADLIAILKDEVNLSVKAGLEQKRADAIGLEIDKLTTVKPEDATTLHLTLLAISPLYKSVMNSLREKLNLLPPSGGMAGIYSMVDNQVGVFQSPANVSVGSVIKPCVNLTNDEQEDLNVPLDGKAINAIRTFPGKGILVWGARTLDGNSQDWRYVSVRRTVIFIEQSIKYATEPYVFAPNTSATWTNVRAMITNFLTNVWQSGALAGATPEDAFHVEVGLGSTMTPVDILDGIMRVTVLIAVTRPAEFIVLTFQQKMQQS